MRIVGCVIVAIVCGLLVGCRQAPQPTPGEANQPEPASQPSAQPVSESADTTDLVAPCSDSINWNLEEATAKLAEEASALCAAIRLVQLQADAAYLADAEERADLVPAMGLAELDEQRLVLGIVDAEHPGHYWSPWLIAPDGTVVSAGDPNTGPNLVRVSSDASVFPHLIVTPERVFDPNQGAESSLIKLEPDQPVRFAICYQGEWPYVALVLSSDPKVEVTRYRWMPYELMFHGPIYDDLPEPAEGAFHVNLEASEGLEPVGGKIPPPIDPKGPVGQPGQEPDILPI